MLLLLSISLSLLADLFAVGGHPQVIEKDDAYERIALTDSSTLEVYQGPETNIIVLTVCAPQCSSCARVFNKEWKFMEDITPPFTSIFPLATIDKETGSVIWKDNDKWEY